MNKNKLRNIIELVVRKEVKKQLSEIFINEKEEIKLAETISKPKPKKVINKPKKQYTKNYRPPVTHGPPRGPNRDHE